MQVQIDAAFSGFPGLAHGGYVCGLLADRLGDPGSVRATFRRPVPTGVALELGGDASRAELRLGDEVLASGEPASPPDIRIPPPVDPEEAVRASSSYLGHRIHPFPTCFCCGPENATGLHLFAGPVPGQPEGTLAAPWTPAGPTGQDVAATMLWAALDCPAIWSLMQEGSGDPTRVVTGQLHGWRPRRVRAGEPCIVTAWRVRQEPKKRLAAAALHDRSGQLLAVLLQTCVEVEGWGVPISVSSAR